MLAKQMLAGRSTQQSIVGEAAAMFRRFLFLLMAVHCMVACSDREQAQEERTGMPDTTTVASASETPSSTVSTRGGNSMGLSISSSAFNDGGAIPQKYTCDGENISPPLSWGGIPEGTQSIALIVDDPDAPKGTWVHWVAYNIPLTKMMGFGENVPKDAALHNHTHQGMNSSGKTGYTGPCPPDGKHRYFFKLYALDAMLPLEGDVTKERLIQAMTSHILAEAELMGTYERSR